MARVRSGYQQQIAELLNGGQVEAAFGRAQEAKALTVGRIVEEAARAAVEKMRSEPGPQFIESLTYRFRAHSMFDAELYRDKAEVEAWRSKGPLVVFKAWAEQRNHLAQSDFDRLETEADAVIADAVAFAEAAEWENIADLTRDVMTPTAPATEVA